ncbi:MAG: hypothetical protein JNL83_07685 [Myxococcales bacterium]|nr:hypothetical protein [Myxococcales bacterium]
MRLSRIATIIPDAPAQMPAVTLRRYALLDRGSYLHADDVPPPAGALALAQTTTDRALRIASTRLLVFEPGDYLLAHHDPLHGDHRVELIYDLSPAPAPSQVRYRRGRGAVFFVFPCTPGAACVVERDPTTQSYHTYVSRLHAGASIVRLVIQLVDT